jgi:hypothetical protein
VVNLGIGLGLVRGLYFVKKKCQVTEGGGGVSQKSLFAFYVLKSIQTLLANSQIINS